MVENKNITPKSQAITALNAPTIISILNSPNGRFYSLAVLLTLGLIVTELVYGGYDFHIKTSNGTEIALQRNTKNSDISSKE